MSPVQTAANRANAQRSTGPRTEEGKARSSQNSIKHGLTSKAVILPHEDLTEFEHLHEGIIARYQPATEHERALANVVAETFWRRQRMYHLEASFMSARTKHLMEQHTPEADPAEVLTRIFTDPEEMTRARLMLRYVTAAERAYRNAVADLEKAQQERHAAEASAAQPEGESFASDGSEQSDELFINAFLSTVEQPSPLANGFVSQTPQGQPAPGTEQGNSTLDRGL